MSPPYNDGRGLFGNCQEFHASTVGGHYLQLTGQFGSRTIGSDNILWNILGSYHYVLGSRSCCDISIV